jgi:3-phenylpropionate/trans-cinnamate dioxygenase ferredoxin component
VSGWVRVGKKSDFASDGVFAVKAGDTDVCVVKLGDNLYALDNRCTHAEAQLSAGDVEEGEVVCPLHGARFDVKTGEALTPPATVPVRTHELKVQGDEVLVRLSDVPAAP